MKIVIGVCTYKRPKRLKRLLKGLDRLIFSKVPVPDIRIIVVDNEGSEATKMVCDEMRASGRWVIDYEIEFQRGISHARNKVFLTVRDFADFIAFIDDDEEPSAVWLDELLYVQELYNADVVGGPVLGRFEEDVSTGILKESFYDRTRYPTGTFLEFAATNNVLIRLSCVKKSGLLFDVKYALTGREDTKFFMSGYRLGWKIIWADDAIVYDCIPKERATIKWFCRRGYYLGNGRIRVLRDFEEGDLIRTRYFPASIKGIVTCAIRLFLSSFSKKYSFLKSLQAICYNMGMLTALVGLSAEEYRKASDRMQPE